MKISQTSSAPAQPLLEMRHLLMIQAIAQTGNLTRAAETLAVTPSALSHRLGEAERRMGRRLCDREGRKVTLTPAGQTILRSAEQALALVTQAEADLARLHGGGYERAIRLAVGHYGAYDWFPDFYGLWQDRRTDTHVYVRPDMQRDPVGGLRDGLVDVILVPYRPRDPDLLATELFADELVFLCPPGDPLAGADWIEGADLADREFLTYTRVVVPDQEYERFIRPSGARTDRWVDMEDPNLIARLVARGRGVSILSRWATAAACAAGGVATVRITRDGLPVPWCAVIKQAAAQDEQLVAVVDALRRFFNPGMRRETGFAPADPAI